MRVQVALTPAEVSAQALRDSAAVVVDVLRATTTVVAACAAGCRRIIPVRDEESAMIRAADFPPGEVLLAGERGGEAIAGFDLGNSPLEYTAERVRGRTIILTTTNGTASMVVAGGAAAAAVAALTNVEAAARWACAQGRDVTVLCSGEAGGFSLEDGVCAGLLVDRMESEAGAELSDAAVAARRLGQHYALKLHSMLEDSAWARHLMRAGRLADLEACLSLGSVREVPVFDAGVIVPGAAAP